MTFSTCPFPIYDVESLLKEVQNLKSEYEKSNQEWTNLASLDELIHYSNNINYMATFPEPEFLKSHKKQNSNSYYIQIIGARGNGKSTFVTKILKRLKIEQRLINNFIFLVNNIFNNIL